MDDQGRRELARRRRSQAKRRRQRTIILKGIFTFIIIVGIIAALFLWRRYGPSKERADLDEYYGIKSENQLAVVVNNGILEPGGMLSDGKAYVEYSLVRDYINERFYWDPNENTLLYTLPNDVVSVGVGNKEYSVSKAKNSVDYTILRTEGSTAYIALDFVKQYTDMDYEVYDNPGRVMICTETGTTTVAEVKRDTQVRYQGGVKSPVLTDVEKKEVVTVIETEGSWKKVRTEDGFIGYIKESALKKEKTEKIDRGFEEPDYTSISKDYTINMAWHNVTNTDANSSVLEMIAQTKGLTTISPTWFHVADTAGNLESISSADYVNYAHQSNIEVWASIRDFDGGINSQEESYELLSHTSNRDNLINQLIAAALQVGLDGINVDFEKISTECGEHYIQFIRELSVKCRQNGLVLSVDNYVPQAYNQQYHRKEQGVFADYVIIMGYDEHYAGSPEAGPVASYNFVKEGIEQTLKEVPAEKVINAVPFFTRVWKETAKTAEELRQQEGTESAEYSMNVESEAYSMTEVENILSQVGVTPTWDDEVKQNYATWESEGSTYEVWVEDASSLEPKLQLIKEYGLAGSAAWRLGYEKTEIWDLILKYVN
ncbi:glycosyl hydrolase family 18 protein [Dorea acetigenes]|uniref:Glycosyl hydrolase family 18 protein n=1 Tax=Dorea acetigenes TaxID=2981787 RepID=A0ABT2RL50_9FIRM|nr:glycosyl hydrolase family 18 protein [Dorea acetigenes]MCB6416332.1 SH3 domain-containing protein [Faecalimonas umbilicata]MCU6686120.1 glycosyl hydrolase family 18 protein [Dorea acetigenes]SCI79604.1 Putative sporulation-specific glycosylase ydhD [uncultured Clostridium sp.]